MKRTQKQWVVTVALAWLFPIGGAASLLGVEGALANSSAYANSLPGGSVLISQGLRSDGANSKASYDCGQAVITITQLSQSRWMYESVSQKGQSLTIRNGTVTPHSNYSTYNFDDGRNHMIFQDYGDNTGGLITSGNPNASVDYDCKLIE